MAKRSVAAMAAPRQAADISDELIAALRMGVMRLSRRLRLESASEELNITQFNVLAMLANIGPLTPGELAIAERVKPPSMTRVINSLEEMDLVTKTAHASDGRQVVVELTPRAHDVLAEMRSLRNAWLRDHLHALRPDELATLAAAAPLLERIAAS